MSGTAIGRATVLVLGKNDARRLDLRAELLARRELACKNFERFTFPGGASGQVQPTVVLPF